MSIPLSSFNHCWRILGVRSLGVFAHAYVTGTPKEVRVAVDGLEHPVILRVGTTDVAIFKQVFVKQEYRRDLQPEPLTIIDAGANIGLTAVYFANRYPRARILSIEPESGDFELLCRNTEPYPNVRPIQAALWNENGCVRLVDPGIGEWGFRTQALDWANPAEAKLEEVPAVTLDRLMKDHDFRTVDLFKLNVEGAEIEIMESSRPWIDRVNVIMADLHDRFRPGCRAAFAKATSGFDLDEPGGPVLATRRGAGQAARRRAG